MGSYPKNTVAQFTTKLPHMIALDDDWEVGLWGWVLDVINYAKFQLDRFRGSGASCS